MTKKKDLTTKGRKEAKQEAGPRDVAFPSAPICGAFTTELNPKLDLVSQLFKHCDEYIDDETQPAVLRKFLERARSPGHGMLGKEPFPELYATYNGDGWMGVDKGDRVRVTMASRLGDVGLTKNFAADHGYTIRTSVDNLIDFSDKPY